MGENPWPSWLGVWQQTDKHWATAITSGGQRELIGNDVSSFRNLKAQWHTSNKASPFQTVLPTAEPNIQTYQPMGHCPLNPTACMVWCSVNLLLESQGGELLASELWRATFWRCLPLRKDLEQCSVWDSGDLRTKFRSLELVLGVSSWHKELPQNLAPRFKELLAQFSAAYSGSPECCVVLVEAEPTAVQNFCTFVQKSSFSGNCTSSFQRPYGSLRFWNLPLELDFALWKTELWADSVLVDISGSWQ